MWHPDVEDIEEAHEQAGFVSRIRNPGFHMSFERGIQVLEEIIEKAKEQESIHTIAAVYLRDLISEHPFSDGNHRTAFMVTLKFLRQNGEVFVPYETLEKEEIVNVLKNEIKFKSTEEIAKWIKTGEFP